MSKHKKSSAHKVCCFCKLSQNDELMFGKFLEKENIVTHYYCLLLSANIQQRGEDHQGILGFLLEDIRKEIIRGKRLVCLFCKKNGATVGCCNLKCRKIFHYPCGVKAGALNQFFGEYRSFCLKHRPKQKLDSCVEKELNKCKDVICYICYENVDPHDVTGTIWAPCCKKNAWFHRSCVQQLATSAGYFFKCPLCNNKRSFQRAMLKFGIFIPKQDASWELVPNAFQELLYRHNQCDAAVCLCPKSRKYTNLNSKNWKLILCRTCGSQGIHVSCGQLKCTNPFWECSDCISVLGKHKESASSTEMKHTFLIDNNSNDSDSDISVGNDSPIPFTSTAPIVSEEAIISSVKLRPGPLSFKLRQQYKRNKMMQDNVNSVLSVTRDKNNEETMSNEECVEQANFSSSVSRSYNEETIDNRNNIAELDKAVKTYDSDFEQPKNLLQETRDQSESIQRQSNKKESDTLEATQLIQDSISKADNLPLDSETENSITSASKKPENTLFVEQTQKNENNTCLTPAALKSNMKRKLDDVWGSSTSNINKTKRVKRKSECSKDALTSLSVNVPLIFDDNCSSVIDDNKSDDPSVSSKQNRGLQMKNTENSISNSMDTFSERNSLKINAKNMEEKIRHEEYETPDNISMKRIAKALDKLGHSKLKNSTSEQPESQKNDNTYIKKSRTCNVKSDSIHCQEETENTKFNYSRLVPEYVRLQDLTFRVHSTNKLEMILFDKYSVKIDMNGTDFEMDNTIPGTSVKKNSKQDRSNLESESTLNLKAVNISQGVSLASKSKYMILKEEFGSYQDDIKENQNPVTTSLINSN